MIGMLRTAHRFSAALLLVACTWAAAPHFGLRDTGGAEHTPAEWSGKKAVLLLFVTTDCPVAEQLRSGNEPDP